jgi:hypothetical protein
LPTLQRKGKPTLPQTSPKRTLLKEILKVLTQQVIEFKFELEHFKPIFAREKNDLQYLWIFTDYGTDSLKIKP